MGTMTAPTAERPPAMFSRAALRDRRVHAITGLGFATGMPFLLVYITQSAWLSDAHVPLGLLGLMSELTLAYKFKFVWAPFLERRSPWLLGRLLGRQRGWIVLSQLAVIAMLTGVAFGDPGHRLWWTVGFSLALGAAGATQDVVVDGWRITSVPRGWQPLMTSWGEVGFRIGNLAAGAGALYLADAVGWRAAYLCMALLMLPGMLAAWWAPEPAIDLAPGPAAPAASLALIIWTPIRELLGRLGPMAIPVLLLVAGFRMPGYVSSAMAIPLFKHLHYSNSEIATVTKIFGVGIALLGTLCASVAMPRLGLMASLLFGTVFASASHLALAYLALQGAAGHHPAFWVFALAVSTDGFAYAYAFLVLITYMSTLVSARHAASQFALLTSLCAFPGSILAGASGFLIARLGFVWFFVGTSLIGLPVALLCWYVLHVHRRDMRAATVVSAPALLSR